MLKEELLELLRKGLHIEEFLKENLLEELHIEEFLKEEFLKEEFLKEEFLKENRTNQEGKMYFLR